MGLVIAVETSIEIANRLTRNTKLSRYQNLRLRKLSVGATTQNAWSYLKETKSHASGLFPTSAPAWISILTASPDVLCGSAGRTGTDDLKVGADNASTTGDEKVINQFRPVIQVEIERNDAGIVQDCTRCAAPNSPTVVLIPAETVHALLAVHSLARSEVST